MIPVPALTKIDPRYRLGLPVLVPVEFVSAMTADVPDAWLTSGYDVYRLTYKIIEEKTISAH